MAKTSTISVIVLLLLALCGTVIIVSALSYYVTVHQSPVVPPGTLAISWANGTVISNGTDLTNSWMWNITTQSFTLPLIINNTGTVSLVTGITTDLNVSWSLTITGNGTLLSGHSQNVTLTLTPPLLSVPNSSPGDFNIWFTG